MRRPALVLLALLAAALSGCSTGIDYDLARAPAPGMATGALASGGTAAEDWQHPKGKVTVWSYYAGADWIVPIVRAQYPDLDIEITAKPWDHYADAYLAAVDAGKAPDVLLADNNLLGGLLGTDTFADLSVAPFEGEAIAGGFPSGIIEPYRTLEDRHLYALPLDINPGVVYYRQDLFQKAGLPADPEDLGRYLEKPANWLAAALKLKDQGAWMASSEWDPIWMTEMSSGFFNRSFSYMRDTSAFAAALDLSRSIRKLDLASGFDLGADSGKAALDDGRTAMFFNGWWYRDALKQAAPDTAGRWRIARLPLGLYGLSGSSAVLISASSSNKPGAWAVAHALAEQTASRVASGDAFLNGQESDPGDPFFGGQQTEVLYARLVRRVPSVTLTPLDEKAQQIWYREMYQAIGSGQDADAALEQIRQIIVDSLRPELNIMQGETGEP